DVGQVHHVCDAIAARLQLPAQQGGEKERAQVAGVGEVPHRRSAGVHAAVSGLEGLEDFLGPGERVVKLQGHLSIKATACAAMPARFPSAPSPSGDVALTLTAPRSTPMRLAMLASIS